MTQQIQKDAADSVVCYCYQLTAANLVAAYRKEGTLSGVQKVTRAGTGCGGCRVVLQSLFGDAPDEINDLGTSDIPGATACVKPGMRIMKSFIIADEQLESRVFSSNAVPPQLVDCDSTTPVEYALLNSRGEPVLHRQAVIKTNETFVFDTRREKLPRPFYGMFLYALGRSNYGASRFNVAWSNGRSVTSTHENASTGRPDVVLPILVDSRFLAGPNTIFLALQNPHQTRVQGKLSVFDVNNGEHLDQDRDVQPGGTIWINANRELYGPALMQQAKATVALRIYTADFNVHGALTVYFFLHNNSTGLWTSNHM